MSFLKLTRSHSVPNETAASILLLLLLGYLLLVRLQRYNRAERIQSRFAHRPLSSMTTRESFDIMRQLQELEFPYAMNKARKIALLKAGAIPTMSKLFAATGQNNRRNGGKRAVDTEILLREAQSQPQDSLRYRRAVARMNYLHARFRSAGKILDDDMLHTLGTNVVEIFRLAGGGSEWRGLSDVERCAVGVFHRNLGEDMLIPFDALPSYNKGEGGGGGGGWRDGCHFAEELCRWTEEYEEKVAHPVETGDRYVRVYVDMATEKLPRFVTGLSRKVLGFELDERMRRSLNLPSPGLVLSTILTGFLIVRKLMLRHLALPRRSRQAIQAVDSHPNPSTGLFHFTLHGLQPWYVEPNWWNRWGPGALVLRVLGGKAPGAERFHPAGYDLRTIGPEPQAGKGGPEMDDTIGWLGTRDMAACPFSSGLHGMDRK